MPTKVVGSLLKEAAPILVQFIVTHIPTAVAQREQSRVNIAEIMAQRDVLLEELRGRRELIATALHSEFRERAGNFERMFGALDQALTSNDAEQLKIVMSALLDYAKTSPLAHLADLDSKLSERDYVFSLKRQR